MEDVILRRFTADDADWLVGQHRRLYAREEGFDDSFGDLVAGIVGDFLANHDPDRERGWVAEAGGRPLGSIFSTHVDAGTAKLRLFLVLPEARGQRLGWRLLEHCMAFARDRGYRRMTLWTHESQAAACALYEKAGWQVVDRRAAHSFGRKVVELIYEIDL